MSASQILRGVRLRFARSCRQQPHMLFRNTLGFADTEPLSSVVQQQRSRPYMRVRCGTLCRAAPQWAQSTQPLLFSALAFAPSSEAPSGLLAVAVVLGLPLALWTYKVSSLIILLFRYIRRGAENLPFIAVHDDGALSA